MRERGGAPAGPRGSERSPLWKTALRGLPLVLLGLVLWRERPWSVRLAAGAPATVAAAIVLNLMVFLPLKAARWRVALTDPPPFRRILAATLEGLLANAAIGFGSGDLVRAARLRSPDDAAAAPAREAPTAAPTVVRGPDIAGTGGGRLGVDYASTWAERGAEVLALAVLVFVTAVATHLGTLALVLSGATAGAYVVALAAGPLLVARLGRWPRIKRASEAGLQASTPGRIAAMSALSLLGWATELGMLLLFQTAFHLVPSLRTAVLTLVGINAAIVIPSVPGNFGTFEAGASMALIMGGAPRDVAVTYALTYHLSHVVPVTLIATAVYFVRSHGRYRPATARPSSEP